MLKKRKTFVRRFGYSIGVCTHLAGRSYRGLEQKVGETKVKNAVVGRGGIAMSYGEEGKTDDVKRTVDSDGEGEGEGTGAGTGDEEGRGR